MNPTSLLHWYDPTAHLGIPTPRTEIVRLPDPVSAGVALMTCIVHEDEHDARDATCETRLGRLRPEIEAAAERIGYPLFLRTDLTSGKHSYAETCHVPDADSLWAHVCAVAYQHEMALWLDRDAPLAAIVLRELLPLAYSLVAFNGLPIGPERRYFVRNGAVLCHHPYWSDVENIRRGMRRGLAQMPARNLESVMDEINTEPAEEVALLADYAERIARALSGAWSVDSARTGDGAWYLIDMAVAHESWHPLCDATQDPPA